MTRSFHLSWLSLLTATFLLMSSNHATSRDAAAPAIDYSVTVPNIASETFVVSARLHNISRDTLTFYFPIWAPGAYDIVNFGAYVQDFTATGANGRSLKVMRGDTNTFRIIGARDAELHISYKVKDIESVPNSLWFGLSDIESDYAFAVGAALFGYPEGLKEIPYTVNYSVPSGWDIAIGLDQSKDGPGRTYEAKNYDELVDAPLQMGTFQRLEFTLNNTPHIITITAPQPLNDSLSKAFIAMTKKIVEIQTSFFGDMPYKRYVFQHYLVTPKANDRAFGALEHANSSTYRMPYFAGGDPVNEMAPVISHEFWHLWSPKRIHVSQLGPFDYQHAPHTKSLWFHEGLTEYYARLLLVRNAMIPPDEYVEDFNNYLTLTYGKPQRTSITELSWKIAEAGLTETTGLYSKGPLLGLLLDAEIRMQTNNKKSLDDAMKYFNDEYGKTGRTFSDDDIIPTIERVTGASLGEFYRSYIDGHDPLPYGRLLPKIGLKIATSQEDASTLGAKVASVEGGWRVADVEKGGTADSTGLHVGDVVASVSLGSGEGSKFSLTDIPAEAADQVLEQIPTYIPATLLVKRDGRDMKLRLKYVLGKREAHRAAIDDNASPEALKIRKSMFGF